MPDNGRISTDDKIRVGMRISLDLKLKDDAGGTEGVLTLSSVVEELLEDGCMLIQMPTYQGYHYPLPADDPILMKFWADSKLYALYVVFAERVQQNGLVFAKVRRTSGIEPHQQRDCYRLNCSLPVTFERIWRSEAPEEPKNRLCEGMVVNLSDGGMLFTTGENIDKGEKLTLTVDLGKAETIEGTALRTERTESGDYLVRVAVRFSDRDPLQKRRFYKYIIDKQLEERRRWTSKGKPLY